eukprot:2044309-Rhodomonas_salina.1
MTPIVNTELVLERMRKGQAAWDPVLLGGRDKYVLPKVRKAEGTPGGSFREIDTSEMSTSAMIQVSCTTTTSPVPWRDCNMIVAAG